MGDEYVPPAALSWYFALSSRIVASNVGAACTRAGSWIINIISLGFSVAFLVGVALWLWFVGLDGSTMVWVALKDVAGVALGLVDWVAVV